mmetsp:Transcript_8021/g.23840  ORF Transcript_8021/g.23840 Transcript_8021/m.23840 type:complete len:145 (+) Transcript_8021:3227-3661(+)
MDPKRRAIYDSGGGTTEDEGGAAAGAASPSSSCGAGPCGDVNERRWEDFFQAIFHEMVTGPATKYGTARQYRGSNGEVRDVLEYWDICKGDLSKMARCIVHMEKGQDEGRLMRDIVRQAIRKGEAVDYTSGVGIRGCKRGGRMK